MRAADGPGRERDGGVAREVRWCPAQVHYVCNREEVDAAISGSARGERTPQCELEVAARR